MFCPCFPKKEKEENDHYRDVPLLSRQEVDKKRPADAKAKGKAPPPLSSPGKKGAASPAKSAGKGSPKADQQASSKAAPQPAAADDNDESEEEVTGLVIDHKHKLQGRGGELPKRPAGTVNVKSSERISRQVKPAKTVARLKRVNRCVEDCRPEAVDGWPGLASARNQDVQSTLYVESVQSDTSYY
ncbi:hypothetical protein DIPPA_35309 [Diplonema papillatum]|nr:hypothetical protein DIPPA_35309 [Diplonema papillatum]